MLILHGVEAWRPVSHFTRLFLSVVDVLVSVSEFTRRAFLDLLAPSSRLNTVPSFILPNCTDLLRFVPGPKSDLLLDRYDLRGRKVLMTLARLDSNERYKGIDQVLEVLPRLRREVPGVCYLVAGEGSDKPRLMHKARSLGLSVGTGRGPETPADVLFVGWVMAEEKVEHYRLADAFVMPGWGEGFGIVYLEALACGIPVLGSKLDASRETLQGCDTAFLANPHDPGDVLKGILCALKTTRGRVPQKIHTFSRGNFQRRFHSILDSTLSSDDEPSTQGGQTLASLESFGRPVSCRSAVDSKVLS